MSRSRQSGFSLIELSVVLVIVGLLIGGGIVALDATQLQARRSDQKRQMAVVREALYGFAMAEGRLPCPDTSYPPDGSEDIRDLIPGDSFDCPVGDPDDDDDCECDGNWGAVPWVDLGVEPRDAWGYWLRYRIYRNGTGSGDLSFADPDADSGSPAFRLDEDNDGDPMLSVEGDIDPSTGDREDMVTSAPAVVVSYGPQGRQLWQSNQFVCVSAGVDGFSEDENENCDDNNTFVAAGYRTSDAGTDPANAGEGRFDDMVIWLSTPILKARMVDAGRLP